jgi:hypothetical protein
MPEPGPLGETLFEARVFAIVLALLVNNPAGGWVESVFTLATHLSFFVVSVFVVLLFVVFAPVIDNPFTEIVMRSRIGEFASKEKWRRWSRPC